MGETWKTRAIYRIIELDLEFCAKKYMRGRLIDIGCGTKPFAASLAPSISEYVGLDRPNPFNQQACADLVGSAYAIPAADGTFDSAVSVAVLEHLAEPLKALKECHRVLKPGGYALLGVPLTWHVHAAPEDYFRFTEFGMRHLLEQAGFEVVEIRPLSGIWITWATLFCYYLDRFNRGPFRRIPIIPAIGLALQRVGSFLDRLDPTEDWTWMYNAVARKSLN